MLVTIDLSIVILFCFPYIIYSSSTDISKISDVKDTEKDITIIKPNEDSIKTFIKPNEAGTRTIIKPNEASTRTIIKPNEAGTRTIIKPNEDGIRTIIKPNEAGINVASMIHVDDIDNKKMSDDKNNGHLLIPIHAEKHDYSEPNSRNKVISPIAMEGGGVIQQASTLGNPNQAGILTEIDDGEHAKGSKGRKGVLDQFSSVVARKGVDPDGTGDHYSLGGNNSSGKSVGLSSKESTVPVNTEKPASLNTTEDQTHVQSNQLNEKNVGVQKISQAKKSEVVSDVGDTEDYDQYLIIKTSTTGEDYVIIGVVIVIGIWFSVFAALIFYRRAGEYWDRRHYRRMDFLVEGMYND
ncbi:hypothetical protein J6590_049791 [Homalodisca vitripennis]|nr:hypothetical protein J6590_049791 [Homalodisca vitripennis]